MQRNPSQGGFQQADMRLIHGRLTVLFDGDCGLCQRTMTVIRRLDVFGRVEICDVLRQWRILQNRYPQLSHRACIDDMHAVTETGAVFTGFAAYRALAWVLPAGWLLLPLLYLPGVAWAGQRVYRRIADSRYHNGCPVRAPSPPAAARPPSDCSGADRTCARV